MVSEGGDGGREGGDGGGGGARWRGEEVRRTGCLF